MTHSQSMRLNPRAHMPLHYSHSLSNVNNDDPVCQIFDRFCAADTFIGIMDIFEELCYAAGIFPKDHIIFYQQLKNKLMSWRAQLLWSKLDKRASNREYKSGTACNKTRVLVVGAGPCGLRVAIEMALLGAKAVVVEKRDSFSRNNVLHLWPFLIHDLKALGAKKFFGKFCAGAIDHISIRTLQCILLKVALLVGVEIHPGVSFEGFLEPQHDAGVENSGWRANVIPGDHPVSEFIFDVCFSADGKRNTMTEFKRKELRGKFAIGITANFINRKTQAEATVDEISGVSFIFNQKFFKDLHEDTGIDLENIVYYKDETHYFVMTAKKQSLLRKGVLKQDHDDLEMLLSKENLNHDALLSYAREAADYSTNHDLPSLDFALNYTGQPDVDMFDFTSMFAAENASRVVERRGHLLLIGLVGDTLLEPFWPTGSGCARGFLGALDGAWMVRSWASGKMSPLEVIAERESVYQLLSQTKPDNLNKNYMHYTIDPNTRYVNLQMHTYKPYQAESLYDGKGNCNRVVQFLRRENPTYGSSKRKWNLLKWFQKELESYENLVTVIDFSKSWRSGLALCALIHRHWPHLVDVFALDPKEVEYNSQLAFDILKEHCKIMPPTSGRHKTEIPEEKMINFLLLVQDYFKRNSHENRKTKSVLNKRKSSGSAGSLSKVLVDPGSNAETNDKNTVKVKISKSSELEDILSKPRSDESENTSHFIWKQTKVSALARDLVLKFKGEYTYDGNNKQNQKLVSPERQRRLRDICCFCKERVFVTERCIAEGQLFHRQCFMCEYCNSLLDVSSYSVQKNEEGADIFCHPRCHEMQMRKKENPLKQFNSRSSWVIAPVDRATFESTRKILLRQSQMKKNHRSKSQFESNSVNQPTFRRVSDYDDDFRSATEQELCFSDDSDSEKPDLSWDEYTKSTDEKTALSNVVRDSSTKRQQITLARMNDDRSSDADWETDTSDSDTDIPSSDESTDDKSKRIAKLSEAHGSKQMANDEVKQNKNSEQKQESRLKNRMAFFGAVAEPVRINARQFLGLDQQIVSDTASKESRDDAENSEKKNSETVEKSITQNENEEEKQELMQEKESDTALEISSRQHQRRRKHKAKKKKLLRARKQISGEKTNDKLSETAIAGSALAAERQTVAVVPLSEESSSDSGSDGNTKDSLGRYVHLKNISQQGSSVEEQDESSSADPCLVAFDDIEQHSTEIKIGKTDSEPEALIPSHVTDEQFSDSETNAPRPGLLVAEAMFRSYEEDTVLMTSSGSENCFDGRSDNDTAELLGPERYESDVGEDIGENSAAPGCSSMFSYSETEEKDLEMGNCEQRSRDSRGSGLLNEHLASKQTDKVDEKSESVFVDLEHDSINQTINDSCAGDLSETQNDSISIKAVDDSSHNIGSLIHEDVDVREEALVNKEIGLGLPCVHKNVDDCDDGKNFSTNDHLEVKSDDSDKRPVGSDQHTELVNRDLGQIRRKEEKLIGECLETKSAPKAMIESFSEDDDRDIKQYSSRESLEKDNDYMQQSQLTLGQHLQFMNDEFHADCVDPMSRLDHLLRSLSSKSCHVSESATSGSPLSLDVDFSAKKFSSSDLLSVPDEQQQKKLQSETKTERENLVDGEASRHATKEKSVVDENVNYIHPSLVCLQENAMNEELKLDSNSFGSNKCLCMIEGGVENLEDNTMSSSVTETKYKDKCKPEPKLALKGTGMITDKNSCTESPVSLLDAKRKFFQEVAQPVRLNPLTIFKSDFPSTQSSAQSSVAGEKPSEAALPQKDRDSIVDSLVNCKISDEEKQTEISGVQSKEDKAVESRLTLTIPTDQSPFDSSNKTGSSIDIGVSDPGQRVEPRRLCLSESEMNQKAAKLAKRRSASGVLSVASLSLKANERPLVTQRCLSLPNVQLSRAADENEKALSQMLAENLRLDHQNFMKTLDKMKAGSSSITEFRNTKTDAKTDELHSISVDIPNCLDELIQMENEPVA